MEGDAAPPTMDSTWVYIVHVAGLAAGRGRRRAAWPPRAVPHTPDAGPNARKSHKKRGRGPRGPRRSLPQLLVHTDLSDREANDLVVELEAMLRQISTYWGRPMQGTIECYVVRDFDNFPPAAMDAAGISGIRTAGGVTLMRTATDGNRYLAKSVVYASARTEVVRHESVHAYCHQTFGRVGPVWYSEGMAEMGHYWKEGDAAVRVGRREIHFLHENPPKSLAATLSLSQVSGDSWQNYASRWALCHFLVHDPNYAPQFLSMGRGILAGKDISFDQTYAATARELWFEYLLFLEHIDRGYRVDLCAWDWSKKFACLRPGHTRDGHDQGGPRMAAHRPDGQPGHAVRMRRHGQLADRATNPRPPMAMATTMAAAGWWAS